MTWSPRRSWPLIVALPFASDVKGNVLGHRLTPTPLIITLVILAGLALIALWLWMARATTQGRNWARIVSTVLFGLATLELTSAFYPGYTSSGDQAQYIGPHRYS